MERKGISFCIHGHHWWLYQGDGMRWDRHWWVCTSVGKEELKKSFTLASARGQTHASCFDCKTKLKDYKNKHETHADTQYNWEKNDSSLDFNFILLPNPAVDMNGLASMSSTALFIFGKCHIRLFWSVWTFCEWQIHWTDDELMLNVLRCQLTY